MRNWLATTWKKDPLVFCVWTIAFALLIGFGMSLLLLGHAKLFGGMSVSSAEVLRDIALTVAALLGFPLLLQRTLTATRQADIDSQRLLADRYARSAELFANAELSARLAGLYALWDLAKEEVEIYHLRIMEILCAFVRNPPELKGWEPGDNKFPAQRPDMEAVLALILVRSKQQCVREYTVDYHLNFRKANLLSANLQKADLRGADLSYANLQNARFLRANLYSASFHRADLICAKFHNADLRGVKFYDPPSRIDEYPTESKKLEGVEWQNAALNGAWFPPRMQDHDISAIQNAVILKGDSLGLPIGLPSEVEDKLERITIQEWEKRRKRNYG